MPCENGKRRGPEQLLTQSVERNTAICELLCGQQLSAFMDQLGMGWIAHEREDSPNGGFGARGLIEKFAEPAFFCSTGGDDLF